MKIEKNKNLKNYNTFNIEAFCKEYIEIENTEELNKINFKKDRFIIGGGSNLLITRTLEQVIHLNISEIEVLKENQNEVFIKASAGIKWDDFVLYTVKNKFYGIENLSYIPGTVGASPVQNIGAYGVEVSSVIDSVEYYNIESHKFEKIDNKDCLFGYRDSIFKNKLKNKFIITNVIFKLSKTPKFNIEYDEIKQKLDNKEIKLENIRNAIIAIRKRKLEDPAKFGNAGSFFKNAIVNENKIKELQAKYPDLKFYKVDGGFKIPTAWLIEKIGLKAYRMGNAGVSPKHSLILINYGNASAKEIIELDNYIKTKVFENFGIKISEEVIII